MSNEELHDPGEYMADMPFPVSFVRGPFGESPRRADVLARLRLFAEKSVVRIGEATRHVLALEKQLVHAVAKVIADYTAPPVGRLRDWEISFGPETGTKGERRTITVQPQCLFRGEKLVASDSAATPGTGTRICAIFIGQKSQMPLGGGGTPTMFFGPSVLGNGIRWDACDPALTITMVVEFIEDCTFNAVVFGKAAL